MVFSSSDKSSITSSQSTLASSASQNESSSSSNSVYPVGGRGLQKLSFSQPDRFPFHDSSSPSTTPQKRRRTTVTPSLTHKRRCSQDSFEWNAIPSTAPPKSNHVAPPPPDPEHEPVPQPTAPVHVPSIATFSQPPGHPDHQVAEVVRDLATHGPFSASSANIFPDAMPLRARFESERAARARGLSVSEALGEAMDWDSWDEYPSLWRQLSAGVREPLERSKFGPWETAVVKFMNQDDCVSLSAELVWSARNKPGIFDLKVNPLRFERGYRFGRRFGPDRFLELSFPSLMKNVPQRVSHDVLLKAVTRWLATTEHFLFGRTWRVFFFDETKSAKKSPESVIKNKVWLFAVNGSDFLDRDPNPPDSKVSPGDETCETHTSMSITALLNWHMPLQQNMHVKDMKLFQRFSLGLSRTIPTAVLRKDEIYYVSDMKSPTGQVMNDGCALMSKSLASHIASFLNVSGQLVPCVFQGRILGAKGVWIVDRDDKRHPPSTTDDGERNFWLEINESQLKILPTPDKDTRQLDDEQLTFEVVSWSKPLAPSYFNQQALQVLQHGGIRKDHVEAMLKKEINNSYAEFKTVVKPERAFLTRKWIQKFKPSTSDGPSRKTRRIDEATFPSIRIDQAQFLLDSGFLPLELPFLTSIFKEMLKSDYFEKLDNLRIKISQSAYAYCIADPYGVLAPNEVHLGFSRVWEDEFHGTELDNVDVLVARFPAHLPTDVQKRTAVYKRELSFLKDVIVFPTTGEVPLASELSGGDYDGDQVWLCWDPYIVDAFRNTPFVPRPDRSREMFELIDHAVVMSTHPDINEFLAKTLMFNALPSQLGRCTNEHEKLCYHINTIAADPAIVLADLLGILVDSKKSGLELTERSWRAFCKKYIPPRMTDPAYKKSDDCTWKESNIIDYLKFDVIRREKDRILADFNEFCEECAVVTPDPDLTAPWSAVEQRIASESAMGDRRLAIVGAEMKKAVRQLHLQWILSIKSVTYTAMLAQLSDKTSEFQPPVIDHPLSHCWRNSHYEWERVRASCIYKSHPKGTFPWLATGVVLCSIKAQAKGRGQSRVVVPEIYQALHVSRYATKKLGKSQTKSEGTNGWAMDDSDEEQGDKNDDDRGDYGMEFGRSYPEPSSQQPQLPAKSHAPIPQDQANNKGMDELEEDEALMESMLAEEEPEQKGNRELSQADLENWHEQNGDDDDDEPQQDTVLNTPAASSSPSPAPSMVSPLEDDSEEEEEVLVIDDEDIDDEEEEDQQSDDFQEGEFVVVESDSDVEQKGDADEKVHRVMASQSRPRAGPSRGRGRGRGRRRGGRGRGRLPSSGARMPSAPAIPYRTRRRASRGVEAED